MSQKIIFATGNRDKIREINEIMEDLDVEVVSMKDAGISIEIEENGSTYEENADQGQSCSSLYKEYCYG